MQRGKFDRGKLRGLPRKFKEPLLALMTAVERTTNSVGFCPIETIDSALGTAFTVNFSELWSDIDQLKSTEGNTGKGTPGNSYMRVPIRPNLPTYPRPGQVVSLTSCQTYLYKSSGWKQFLFTGEATPHNFLSTTHPDTEPFTPPARGDLIGGNDSAKWQAFGIGADGSVLTARASGTCGMNWEKPDWEWIDAKTASGSASIDFTDLTADYAAYKIILSDVAPSTDNVSLYLRTSSNNGVSYDNGAGNYAWSQNRTSAAGANSPAGSASTTDIILLGGLGNNANETAAGEVTLYNPSAAKYCRVGFEFQYTDNTPVIGNVTGGGVRLAAADVDAIRFIMSSGNIASGTFTLYGLKA